MCEEEKCLQAVRKERTNSRKGCRDVPASSSLVLTGSAPNLAVGGRGRGRQGLRVGVLWARGPHGAGSGVCLQYRWDNCKSCEHGGHGGSAQLMGIIPAKK